MSKMTHTKKQRLGLVPPPIPKRHLTIPETMELRQRILLMNSRLYEAALIKANTALVPNGQEVAATFEAIGNLLQNDHNHWYSKKLLECGYSQGDNCNVNLDSGEITLRRETS